MSEPAAVEQPAVAAQQPGADDAPTETLTAVPAPEPPEATELVTCPECGRTATVTLNRREARDFCLGCDYPLFWTPSAVLRDPSTATADDSLRRLPGTVGRATVASQPCPHCNEPNRLTAVTCVRCGLPMQLAAPAPQPEPVYLPPPPPPEPEPEPERGVPWWVWALLAFGTAATLVLIVLASLGTFS